MKGNNHESFKKLYLPKILSKEKKKDITFISPVSLLFIILFFL